MLALYRRPFAKSGCGSAKVRRVCLALRLGVLHLLNPYKPEVLRMLAPECSDG